MKKSTKIALFILCTIGLIITIAPFIARIIQATPTDTEYYRHGFIELLLPYLLLPVRVVAGILSLLLPAYLISLIYKRFRRPSSPPNQKK